MYIYIYISLKKKEVTGIQSNILYGSGDIHGCTIQEYDQWSFSCWIVVFQKLYIYMVPPPKTYADFNFTGIYSEFYIFWHRFCSD